MDYTVIFSRIGGSSLEIQCSKEHEQEMRNLYRSLSEKDRRCYVAVEAKKRGHGGIDYICLLFSCDDKTVRKGMMELQDEDALKQSGVRKLGGGRKPIIEAMGNIHQAFHEVLHDHTAGDPMDDKVQWTTLRNVHEITSPFGISSSARLCPLFNHKSSK